MIPLEDFTDEDEDEDENEDEDEDEDFNDVYFEFASVIQLGTLRRFANFTFHENYLSSQSTFGQSYM